MPTGRQIREARRLLRWRRDGLVTRARVPLHVIDRAEASDGEVKILADQETAIRRACEMVGVEFSVGNDGTANVSMQRGRDTVIPTGFQIREGRELVGMSQTGLAAAAGVGIAVVVRAELAAHISMLTRKDEKAIQGALETAGVVFVREEGGGGVRLREGEP